jgi:hypothetical protein
MAMTNRIWIILPALYTKNPKAQRMTRIIAIVYNKFDIVFNVYG